MHNRVTSAFWLVWCPTGGTPTAKHASENLARREAERLARKCPGQQFIVMKSCVAYEVNDITVTDLCDIPF